MSNLDKQVLLQLENTAYYQPRENLNVSFSTADNDSAVFLFKVTKNNEPLLIGDENVIGRIAIRQSGKLFVVAPLEIVDELNGLFKYRLPNDVLQRDGNYEAQVLVAEKGESNTIVAERIFTFNVEKSIFNTVDAETKLQYIIEFDDLLLLVQDRMKVIDETLANGEDYVTQVNAAREKGLSDIQIALTDALNKIKEQETSSVKAVSDKGSEYSSKFDSDKSYVDEQIASFRESVKASGLVKAGDTTNWQKYKLTSDDGSPTLVSLSSNLDTMRNLGPGFYYTTSTPINGATATAGFLQVEQRTTLVKRLTFKPYNSNTIYVMRFYNGEWSDWENAFKDMETTTGSQAKATTAESNANIYTDSKINNRNTTLFEGTANGVGAVINLSETLDNFIVLYIFGTFPGGAFNDLGNPVGTSRITIAPTNIVDADGNGGAIYEVGLNKTTRTQLTISNDVYFDLGNQLGSGANANKCTITKIVGVRK